MAERSVRALLNKRLSWQQTPLKIDCLDQFQQGKHHYKEAYQRSLDPSRNIYLFEPDSILSELEENYNVLEDLGLLTGHELTANLLYHNQIVLYGSAARVCLARKEQLLVNKRLPFEARYRFRDDRVGKVCSAMGRLASEY